MGNTFATESQEVTKKPLDPLSHLNPSNIDSAYPVEYVPCTQKHFETHPEKYTRCYECNGQNISTECGVPQLGCTLCDTYGPNNGYMLREYRYKTLHNITNGVQKTFVPPPYECVECKDTKQSKYIVWDKKLEDPSWSDHGTGNMPYVNASCRECCKNTHTSDYEKATAEYFAKQK
jgi:hypothetical protein